MRQLLIVEDDRSLLYSLQEVVKDKGIKVYTSMNGASALKVFRSILPEVVLLDLKLPDRNGIEILKEMLKINENVSIILMTAYSSVDSAVLAMKLGAFDYIKKPFDIEELLVVINKAFEKVSLLKQVKSYLSTQKKNYGFDNILGKSKAIKKAIETAKKVKDMRTDVLLYGESGTGKELFAKAIHYEGIGAENMFVEINCAAIPNDLIESELFGHEKGAFTGATVMKKGLFEIADGGTIFLDEIGEMPYQSQSKLLRFLESHNFVRVGGVRSISVAVRVIASTNRDLKSEVERGRFRKDLYYRISVIPIWLPPLRARKDDVIIIAEAFLKKYSQEFNKPGLKFHASAIKFMLSYDWPGNVRQLKNAIERATLLAEFTTIKKEDLGIFDSNMKDKELSNIISCSEIPKLYEVEKKLIKKALELTDNNQVKAAKLLGIGRGALRYKIKKYGLGIDESKSKTNKT